jgi:hypothetical protein
VPTKYLVSSRRIMRMCGCVSATHATTQGRQDPCLPAAGALGPAWPQSRATDRGATGRAAREGIGWSPGRPLARLRRFAAEQQEVTLCHVRFGIKGGRRSRASGAKTNKDSGLSNLSEVEETNRGAFRRGQRMHGASSDDV